MRGHWAGRRKPIALRCPCFMQAQGDHCATHSVLRSSPGWPSMATRSTHAYCPWSHARRHAARPWTLREKLSALLRSCSAQKAGGLPLPCTLLLRASPVRTSVSARSTQRVSPMANSARRMRRARVFHAPSDTWVLRLPVNASGTHESGRAGSPASVGTSIGSSSSCARGRRLRPSA
jgi:hypothetical protein